MKCIACGKRTYGLPDRCPSCGALMLGVWRGWHIHALFMGLVLLVNGLRILTDSLSDDDLPWAAFGLLSFGFGGYLAVVGLVLWKRGKRSEERSG